MPTNQERITDLQGELEVLETNFESIREDLEEKKDFLENIESHESEAATHAEEAQNHTETVENLENDIESSQEEIQKLEESLSEQLTSIEVKKERIDKFFTKVFGEEDEDGNFSGGLEQRLDNREDRIDEYINKQEEKFNDTFEQIESLLPGAAGVGLAKAYADQKKEYYKPQMIFGGLFITGIIGFVITALLVLGNATGVESATSNLLSRTPFFFAFAWLAKFSSKEYRKNKLLKEEYAHKEVLAKSYQGYRKEFTNNGDTTASEELDESLVTTFDENPSRILERDPSDDRPTLTDKLKSSE